MTRATAGAALAGRAVGRVGLSVIASGLLVNLFPAIVTRNVLVADYRNFGAYPVLMVVVGFGVFWATAGRLSSAATTEALPMRN